MSSIIINIAGNYDSRAVDKAKKSLDELKRDADTTSTSLSRAFDRAGVSLNKVATRFRGVGQSLTYSLTLPLAAVGATSIQTAADFQKSLNLIEGASDATGQQMKDLEATIRQASQGSIYSLTDVAQVSLDLARAGLTPAEQAAGALTNALNLATAGGTELAESTQTLVNAMAAFHLQASDATMVADALAGAANASTANIDTLGQALAQSASAAGAAGQDLNTTVAALAMFAQNGLKASDAGTSLKTFLLRLSPVSVAAADEMKQLGLSFFDANGNALELTDIAQQLQDNLKNLSQQQRITALQTIFGNDAFRAANILYENGASGLQKFVDATLDSGSAQRMATNASKGAAGALANLKKNVTSIQESIGQALAPTVEKLAGFIDNLAKKFTGLPEGTREAMVAFAAFLAVIGPAALMISGVASALQYMAAAMSAASIAASNMGGKISTAFGMVKQGWSQAATVGSSALAPALTNITASLKGLLTGDLLTARAAFGALTAGIGASSSAFLAAAAPIAAIVAAIALVVGAIMLAWRKSEFFRDAVSEVFQTVRDVVESVGAQWRKTMDENRGSLEVLGKVVDIVGKALGVVFGTIIKTLVIPPLKLLGVLLRFAVRVIGWLIQAVVKFASIAAHNFAWVLEAWSNVVSAFLDGVQDLLDGAVRAFGWVPGLGDRLRDAQAGFEDFRNSVMTSLDETAARAREVASALDAMAQTRTATINVTTGSGSAPGEHGGQRLREGVTDRTLARFRGATDKVAKDLVIDAKNIKGALESMADAAEKALKKFQDRAQKLLDFRKEVQQSIADTAKMTADSQSIVLPTSGSLLGGLQAQLATIKKFGSQLQQLKKLGLGNTALQQIIAAGPTDGSLLAAALLEGGKKAIGQVNALNKQINAQAGRIGTIAAESQFGMTLGQAQGIAATKAVTLNGDIVVQFGNGVSAADRAEISTAVRAAVQKALEAARKEAQRK